MDFDEAKKLLITASKAGRKAGRLVRTGKDQWEIEFLTNREQQYKREEKKKKEELLEKKRKKLEEKERLEKQRIKVAIKKEMEEKIRIQQQLESEQIIRKREEEKRLTQEREMQERENNIRQKIANKFSDARVLMQYRRAGSKGNIEEGTEWGCWIILRDGVYIRSHESPDRVQIANKSRTEKFINKKEAIRFCNWLINNHWYTDTRYLNDKERDFDFPTKEPPNKEEREEAKKNFISYRDLESLSNIEEKN